MYSHEGYRPLGRLEKERWKRIHEPRAWEYQMLTPEELARNRARLEGRETAAVNITAGGLLMLALLGLLMNLSGAFESGIGPHIE